MQRRTTDLKPHPMNRKLYGDEAPPADFIESVRRHGIMVPLAIKEDGTIISGHRRWQAALALGMETVPVQIVDYADDLDEREAIIEFNRQREKTFSQKMAEAEELETVERERARRRKAEAGKANLPTVSAGNVSTTHEDKGRTRDKVAAAVGLGSGRTYETAKKVWEAAKNGDETAKKLVEELDAGKTTVHAAYKELMKEAEAPTPASHPVPAKVADEEAEEVPAKETVFSPEPATPAARPHVAYNSGNNEWYTPPEYIEAARVVMGGIDLDPASSPLANEVVKATLYFTAEDDGLKHPWAGRVWMNPPYSQPLIQQFCEKLVGEFTAGRTLEAIVLVNNATETGWFNTLVEAASAVVFPKGRVKFWGPDGQGGAPLQGQAVLYFGRHPAKFMTEFHGFGWGAYL